MMNREQNDERSATQQSPNHGTEPLSPNTLVQQNVGEGVSQEQFCKIYTQMFGEKIDNIKQLTYKAFTNGGEELLEFINDFLRLLPKEPNVQESDTRDDAMKDQQPETNASPSTSREELAIGFAEWVFNEGWRKNGFDNDLWLNPELDIKSSPELLHLYQQHLNKQ